MKFIATVLLAVLLGYLVYLFHDSLSWWAVAIAAFVAGAAVPQKPWKSWLAGFTGMFLLWGILAWWIDKANEGIMAGRMAQVLPFGGNTMLLMLATALVGGLVGGFAALTGAYLRKKKS